jgi:hypothetical protein
MSSIRRLATALFLCLCLAALAFSAVAAKHLTVLLPAWCGLIAIGLLRFRRGWLGPICGLLIVGTTLASLFNYFTDRQQRDVGTKHPTDRQGKFDAPHLNNIYDSAPYLHNGIANTLEEIWTRYNPYDEHGVTNDMTKDQLKQLFQKYRSILK